MSDERDEQRQELNGFDPLHPPLVMTAEEVCQLLRLDHLGAPEQALQRCIAKGLRPAMYTKLRRYTLAEVERFLADQVERYA